MPLATPANRVQVLGIQPGPYDFRIDGKLIRKITERTIGPMGMAIDEGPDFAQAEELRRTILKKNELFFHRWRPQNNTYLFLFRKYEQGQNAGEIPKFDPLVQAEEKKIARLRVPVAHTYEFILSSNRTEVAESEQFAKPKVAQIPVTPNPATPFKPQPIPEFQIEPGFEVNLFAENPQLAKPIQINFDPQTIELVCQAQTAFSLSTNCAGPGS